MKQKFYLKKIFFTAIMAFLISPFVFGQGNAISGRVTGSEDGEGIPGASVAIKGTTRGTITDVDGNFSINASSDETLVISFVGFSSQEIPVGSQSVINVSLLTDASSLEELVVTGYQTTNLKESTAAVSVVKAQDLKVVPSGNVEQQLQGRVSGVTVITNGQPGTNSIIRVRGFGAFGGNEPLYVVDGLPVGTTDFLSPDDIETTTVLKDAAAASIYGARAANGVIVYTTKRGTKKNQKLQVSYDGLFGSTNPNVKGAYKMLSPQQDADWTKVAQLNDIAINGYAPGSSEYEKALAHPQYGGGTTAVIPDYLYVPGIGGGVSASAFDKATIDAMYAANPDNTFLIKPNVAGTNWYQAITRRAPVYRQSLGFSGGSETSRFYIGMSLQDQKGILINNEFKRYSFRANSEFDLTKRIRFGENLQFTYRNVKGQAGGNNGLGIAADESELLSAFRMPTIIPVYDEYGSFASTRAPGFNNGRNPVRRLSLNNGNDKSFTNQAMGNIYLEIEPINDLVFRSSIGGTYFSYYYTDYNYKYLGDSEPEANNAFAEGSGYGFGWTFTNTAQYKFGFNQNNFTILGGIEALNTNNKGRDIRGSGINPFSMDLDYVTLSAVQNPVVNSGLNAGVNFYSLFGKLDYNYNEKYYVTGLVRRDGSSRFGSKNRYGVFPAFSGAWRLSSEEFMKNSAVFSDVKIRGGWGIMGNSNNVDPNNQYSLFAASRGSSYYPIDGQNNGVNEGYYRSRLGNPAAKWETSVTTNIGFDATLWRGKLEVVFDIWRKDTKDLLFTVPVPAVVGPSASVPSVNVAKMRNEGIDFQIINRGDLWDELKYELTFNNSFLRNNIVELANGATYIPASPTFRGISPIRNQVGKPMSSFYGYQVEGYFNTQSEVDNAPAQEGKGLGRFRYKDVNGDGVITVDDQTWLGSAVPKYTGGLNLRLDYRGFDFETYFYFSAGNKIWNQTKWYHGFYSSFLGAGKSQLALSSWTPELGNSALAPRWETASNVSNNGGGSQNSWYVEKGNFTRWQNLTIGYNLSSDLINQIGIRKARIAFGANNLATFTKYTGLDPMVAGAADTNFGIDVGNYPVTPSWNIVLNLGF